MGFELKSGTTTVIPRTATKQPFHSFFLGVTFGFQAGGILRVDNGVLAVAVSGDSSNDPPGKEGKQAYPHIHDYGDISSLEIENTAGNSLKLGKLRYHTMVHTEATNQTQQLHFYRFDNTDNEAKNWITSCTFDSAGGEDEANDRKRDLVRTLKYDGKSPDCISSHVIHQGGVLKQVSFHQTLSKTPLTKYLLENVGQQLPTISMTSKARDTDTGKLTDRYSINIDASLFAPPTQTAAAIAVSCAGAFNALRPVDLMSPAWMGPYSRIAAGGGLETLLHWNRRHELLAELNRVLDAGTPGNDSLAGLSNLATDSLFIGNDAPMEICVFRTDLN